MNNIDNDIKQQNTILKKEVKTRMSPLNRD